MGGICPLHMGGTSTGGQSVNGRRGNHERGGGGGGANFDSRIIS